jgi:hypothetical protein
MSVLVVPPVDRDDEWPSLGSLVCNFIEDHLVHGPGDLRGEPARVDEETKALIWRMYQVFPQKHAMAGRRRFKRVGLSIRKGTAKTEKAAWLAACELHPEAPVRCIGWDKKGQPIGGGVTDPYIPLVAYTEEQSEDLAYHALRVILELSDLAGDFDIGLERILRKGGDGKAVALATAPDARDGARTTFQHFDETHRFVLPRLVSAHRAMLANIPKRKMADAWSLETTTAPAPGEGSVAEAMMDYARAVANGTVKDARLFFFHREASDHHDLSTDAGVKAAVIEASGPVAEWSDIDSIVEQWKDPTADRAYLERVWLNRLVQSSTQAFSVTSWDGLKRTPSPVKRKDLITLGFDGSVFFDSTGIVGTHVETGYQWKAAVWERPPLFRREQQWQVPGEEVDAKYKVWRLYADPAFWQSWIAKWRGEFGEERVIEWPTNRPKPMSAALENFNTALTGGALSHDGDPDLRRHLGNARKRELPQRDEEGKPLYLIQKERPDSPHKMDLAMCAVLSWEARTDAVAAGLLKPKGNVRMFFMGGQHAPAP